MVQKLMIKIRKLMLYFVLDKVYNIRLHKNKKEKKINFNGQHHQDHLNVGPESSAVV